MQKDDVLDLLEAADWKDIIFRLTYYAVWRARRFRWRSGTPEILPGGKTPEDLALAAIGKVWSGTRDWDPQRYPVLLKHLMWIVDSDIEHLHSSAEHNETERMPEVEDKASVEIPTSQAYEAAKILTPEEELVALEQRDLEERMKCELYAAVKGNDDLEFLLMWIEEGIDKPEEIAARTGWDVSKVYNLKRMLLRKATKVGKALKKQEEEAR